MSHLARLSGLLLSLTVSGAALAAEPGAQILDGLGSIKLAVKDFKTSTDFYVKYFGMKEGKRYNAEEQGVDWPTPGKGSDLVLVHDDSNRRELAPGTAWLVMLVPDAKKLQKRMADDGVKDVSEIRDYVKQYDMIMFMSKDPDGNKIETIQFLGGKAK